MAVLRSEQDLLEIVVLVEKLTTASM